MSRTCRLPGGGTPVIIGGMNLTIREFRVFRAVYELRSFSAAAQAMHMTQSAVSKLCQEMETKVGSRLFERSTRRVEPTLWGHHLYGYACEILGTMEVAERTLRGLASLDVGEISVAASPMMMHGLLIEPVRALHSRHPGLRIELHERSTDATIEHVINGKADFGLVSLTQSHPSLQVEPLYNEHMHAVFSADHPLAGKRRVTWEQLAPYPHVSLHTDFGVRRTVDGVYQQKGLDYVSNLQSGTVLTALGLVKAGLGVTVQPGYIVGFAKELGLQTRKLPDAGYTHPISLIRRWNAQLSPAAEALVEALKARL